MLMIFGHRGARGIFPENTIEGFLYAASLGIYGIELDVVISSDKKVVVSHEPWMNPKLCTKPDNSKVSFLKRKNLFRMSYESIRQYDCGKRGNPDFPEQHKIPACKPLLGEVIRVVEDFITKNNLPPIVYNIEIKSNRVGDNRLHPPPEIFADLVIRELQASGIQNRILLQSFDMRPLKIIHKEYPRFKLGMLVQSPRFIRFRLKKLGFTPDTCGVYYKYVTEKWLRQIHNSGMKVLVWTENKPADIKRHISLGVDGIISDYPLRVKNEKQRMKHPARHNL